jgi:hypothetical protein
MPSVGDFIHVPHKDEYGHHQGQECMVVATLPAVGGEPARVMLECEDEHLIPVLLVDLN